MGAGGALLGALSKDLAKEGGQGGEPARAHAERPKRPHPPAGGALCVRSWVHPEHPTLCGRVGRENAALKLYGAL